MLSTEYNPIAAVADYVAGQVARQPASHTDALRAIAATLTRPGILSFDSALTRLMEIQAIANAALEQDAGR